MSTQAGHPRVLFLSGLQIYPPRSGGHHRTFSLVNALARNGLEVFVYSLAGRRGDYLAGRPSSTERWPSGISEHVDRRPRGFLGQYATSLLALPPVWITAYLRAAVGREGLLPALLREKLRWCDAVVADFPFLHPIFASRSASGKLHVLSTHNVEHHLLARGLKRLLRGMVRGQEVRAAEACDVLVSCCEDDARFFASSARVRRAVVVPNGVDRRRFHGVEAHRERTRADLGITEDVLLVLFTASKWGPNREAFDFLRDFAVRHARLLVERRLHLLAVGNVTSEPVRLAGFTATGRVDAVEPYFAAADAAINPVLSGAGTNVKMCEYIAMGLPILTSRFGARGLALEDEKSALLFEPDSLAPVLSRLRRLFDEEPERLREMAAAAYEANANVIDMDVCARPLVDAIGSWDSDHAGEAPAAVVAAAGAPGPAGEAMWRR